jgi:hypothetical protein
MRGLKDFWMAECRSAESHAQLMSIHCCEVAAHMIHEITQRFITQAAPRTQDEANIRQKHHFAWESAITLITHADLMSRHRPRVRGEILELVKTFCDEPFPENDDDVMKRNHDHFSCTSGISQLCSADLADRPLRG